MSTSDISKLKLIRWCAEFLTQNEIDRIPRGPRGIYVLYKHQPKKGKRKDKYDVVYIGMGRNQDIPSRLRIHKRDKGNLWTHFSAFAVWPNITNDEVAELEGLFRHIYRKDTQANKLNKQGKYGKLDKCIHESKKKWLNPVKSTKNRKK